MQCCKLPRRGLGLRPGSQCFLRSKTLQNYAKKNHRSSPYKAIIANARCADHDLNVRSTELTVHSKNDTDCASSIFN